MHRCKKTCLRGGGGGGGGGGGVANNKGIDQPAHLRSLISAFVICFLESFISRLATSEISNILIVSVVEEIALKLALWEAPKTGFLSSGPYHIV